MKRHNRHGAGAPDTEKGNAYAENGRDLQNKRIIAALCDLTGDSRDEIVLRSGRELRFYTQENNGIKKDIIEMKREAFPLWTVISMVLDAVISEFIGNLL